MPRGYPHIACCRWRGTYNSLGLLRPVRLLLPQAPRSYALDSLLKPPDGVMGLTIEGRGSIAVSTASLIRVWQSDRRHPAVRQSDFYLWSHIRSRSHIVASQIRTRDRFLDRRMWLRMPFLPAVQPRPKSLSERRYFRERRPMQSPV